MPTPQEVLLKSTDVATQAANVAGLKPFQPGATVSNGVINSTVLSPQSKNPFVSPTPTPVPSVANLDSTVTPPLVATPQETQATSLSTRIQTLNDSLTGKSAFKTQAETAAGLPDLQKTQTDLSTQLNQLKNEALAIPQQLQLDATGRGITAGGLAPLQIARLRTNSIAALGVSSLLDATNGLIASAQKKADAAVSAQYDPIQEQIDSATKNLNLILNDPSTKLADKNRAKAQLDIQNQKQATLDQNKADKKAIYDVALKAAENKADALTLQKIQNAKTPTEAIQNAGNFLQGKLDTSVVEVGGRKLLVNNQTGRTIKDLGASSVGLTSNLQTYLANQKIPLTVASSTGQLNTSALNNVVQAGVPINVAKGIWQNILAGNQFDEIRAGLQGQGIDPTILDTFVTTLQTGATTPLF